MSKGLDSPVRRSRQIIGIYWTRDGHRWLFIFAYSTLYHIFLFDNEAVIDPDLLTGNCLFLVVQIIHI